MWTGFNKLNKKGDWRMAGKRGRQEGDQRAIGPKIVKKKNPCGSCHSADSKISLISKP